MLFQPKDITRRAFPSGLVVEMGIRRSIRGQWASRSGLLGTGEQSLNHHQVGQVHIGVGVTVVGLVYRLGRPAGAGGKVVGMSSGAFVDKAATLRGSREALCGGRI